MNQWVKFRELAHVQKCTWSVSCSGMVHIMLDRLVHHAKLPSPPGRVQEGDGKEDEGNFECGVVFTGRRLALSKSKFREVHSSGTMSSRRPRTVFEASELLHSSHRATTSVIRNMQREYVLWRAFWFPRETTSVARLMKSTLLRCPEANDFNQTSPQKTRRIHNHTFGSTKRKVLNETGNTDRGTCRTLGKGDDLRPEETLFIDMLIPNPKSNRLDCVSTPQLPDI